MDHGGKCHHHSEPLLTSQEENSTVRILLVGNTCIILWLMKNSIINTFFYDGLKSNCLLGIPVVQVCQCVGADKRT